ncbi:MAG: EAL domain-containing protein, partial [Epsilonproteobacteria bacterium]|nr:EAL domain-containing protein [Campylobacterota bacterium]
CDVEDVSASFYIYLKVTLFLGLFYLCFRRNFDFYCIIRVKHDVEVSKAIIVLSQSLGYKVIAEGIETEEQENFLKKYHCDMGQGYYFAKPMSSDEIVSFYHQK